MPVPYMTQIPGATTHIHYQLDAAFYPSSTLTNDQLDVLNNTMNALISPESIVTFQVVILSAFSLPFSFKYRYFMNILFHRDCHCFYISSTVFLLHLSVGLESLSNTVHALKVDIV